MFFLFTTIEIPSFATWTGKLATPFFAHSAFSSSSIGLEAFETSVSPRQKRSNPPPVPDVPTVIFTPGSALRKRSAARLISGATVLEPSKESRPVSASSSKAPSGSSPSAVVSAASGSSDGRSRPQPASAKASSRRQATASARTAEIFGRCPVWMW